MYKSFCGRKYATMKGAVQIYENRSHISHNLEGEIVFLDHTNKQYNKNMIVIELQLNTKE